MAISRPFLLALLGIALLAATVFAVQNARNTASDAPAPAAKQSPADQAAPAPSSPGNTDPVALIESAFSADVESASFEGRLTFRSEGETNALTTSGSFVDNGAKEMPEVEIQVSARVPGMNLDLRGGFVTTGERAWFTRGRTAYTVPQATWSQIVEARESGAKPATDSPDVGDLDVDPSGWLRNVKSEGSEQVGGAETTHFSAEVDSARAITEIVSAMSAAGQGSSPLPGAERRLRQSGLTNGDLDVWVGEDKILRRVTLGLSGKGDGGRTVDAELSFALSDVNEPQEIARPQNVRSGLPGGTYRQVANGLLTSVGENVGLDAETLRIGVPVTNSHVKAERAIADRRKVVIFFQNPNGIDDRAVADSVRALDRRTDRVVVLTDVVQNVDQYGSMVEDLGVNQAPAIVVVGRSGNARLVEGYIDAESLVQVVADAR